MNKTIAAFSVVFAALPCHASPSGRTNFLSYGPGAAEEAMGGAVVGLVAGPQALYYNSSRLGFGSGGASAEWTRLMPGLSYSWLGAAAQLKFGALGLGMSSFELGNITVRGNLNDPGTSASSYQRSYMVGTARQIVDGLYTGTTFGLLDVSLAGYGAKSIFTDAGVSYRASDHLTVGATLKNLYFSGLNFGGEREVYPKEIRIGGSYDWRGILFVGQANKTFDGEGAKVFAGVSYTIYKALVFRGGFNGYPAFGIGIKTIGNRFGCDFSYQAKDVSSTQRLTLSYAFKADRVDSGPPDPYTELKDHAESLANFYREESRRQLEAHSMAAGRALRKLLALEPWNGDAAQALSAEAGVAFTAAKKPWTLPWLKRRNRAYLRFAIAYGEDKIGEACATGADFGKRWAGDGRVPVIARLLDKYGCNEQSQRRLNDSNNGAGSGEGSRLHSDGASRTDDAGKQGRQ